MQTFSRALVLAGDASGRPSHEDVLTALAPRFSVAAVGRSHTVRRAWLDTFDWRLHRAGLTLEHITSARPSELNLAAGAGERITQQAGRLSWPSLATALPDGPVARRLLVVAGVRALLPAARAVSAVQDLRVLNDDAKTVAWIRLDQTTVSYPAPAQLPAELRVTSVRGYQLQAERIAHLLAGIPGVDSPVLPPLDAALHAAGRRAADYSSKLNIELAPRMPARLALREVLLTLLDSLQVNVGGTLRDIDTEFLHDLRVAVRRTRSALKLAGDVLPGDLCARFRPEFKWLGDLTTPTRDLDVYLLNYQSMAGGLVSAAPADLEPLREHLADRRVAAHRSLVRGLRSARFTELGFGWRAALTGLTAPSRGQQAADLAADRIGRAHRRVLRLGGSIGPGSPAAALHDLRKRCKELRYLLEIFASLYEPQAVTRVVKDLRGLQDCLGEFQDCQVQQDEVRQFAAQMMASGQAPVSVLLAMGELAGRVGQRERDARHEFAARFGEFASPASERRLRALAAERAGGRR